MIVGFTHKGLEAFFYDGVKKGIQANHAQRLGHILSMLDAAAEIQDMNFPGSRLHQWSGSGKGVWSVNVSGAWRLTFRFEDGKAFEVNYVQPH